MGGSVLLSVGMAILLVAGLGGPVSAIGGDNCAQARRIYKSTTKLLNYEQRSIAFQKAVDLCPSYAEAHVNLADALENLAKINKGDTAKFNRLLDMAATEYLTALKHNSNLFAAYLGLGDTLRVMGLYARSENAYQRALRLRPGHLAATKGLEKIQAIKSFERDGLKTSQEIIEHVKRSSANKGHGTLMGFKDETVVKDRLRFNNILFNTASHSLDRPEALRQLKEIGEALSKPDLAKSFFVIEGHTDNRGGHDMNVRLSWDRAESVRRYLIEHYKVDPSRVQTMGFGYNRPRFPNDSREHMLKNRRVELLFIDRGTGN
jgi:outer membrane protein OmpA-like peptidoglycan-associated protein